MFADKLPPGMLWTACYVGAAGFFAAFTFLALGWAMRTGKLRRNRYFGIRTPDAMESDEAFAKVNGKTTGTAMFFMGGFGLVVGAPMFLLCLPLPLLLLVVGAGAAAAGALAVVMLRAGPQGPTGEKTHRPKGLN